MELKIQSHSKLLMIGDSITDCDRARPVGEGFFFDELGRGYVSLVASMLGAVCPERNVRVINMGVSGNTVRDLKARWQADAMRLQPDWVSIMIGINDVWRQVEAPAGSGWGVPIDEYERTLEEIVRTTLPVVKGMVLMTPYVIEADRSDAMRSTMDRYGAVVREFAEKYGTIFVDTQAAFDQVLPHYHPMDLAMDRVHINLIGHMILARAFAKAIGLDW